MGDEQGQQVPFFGTPINFASLAKMRLLRRRVGREHAERVAAWYMQMRDLAKQGSTFGQFTTNAVLFVESLGAPVPDSDDELAAWIEDRARIWDAFEGVGLIDLEGDVRSVDDLFRVTVVDFAETNRSRRSRVTRGNRDVTMTPAERKAVSRENQRRVTVGLGKMSDEERDSFLASRNVTSRHVTSHHVTRRGEEGRGHRGETPPPPTPPQSVTPTEAEPAGFAPITTLGSTPPPPAQPFTGSSDAQGRHAAMLRMQTELERITKTPDDAMSLAEQIAIRSRQPVKDADGRPIRLPVEAFERTVRVLVRRVLANEMRIEKDPVGLVVAIAHQYEAAGSDRVVEFRDTDPAAPKRVQTEDDVLAYAKSLGWTPDEDDAVVAS